MDGKQLKARIAKTGKTQKEIADLLGVTAQTVSAILSATDVRTGTIERISMALKLPVSFFYDKDAEMTSTTSLRLKDRVWALLEQQDKRLKDLCAYIGITDTGMRKMFARDSCETAVLQKMSEFFGVPASYFLDNKPSVMHESSYADELRRENELLKKLLEEKERTIAILMDKK